MKSKTDSAPPWGTPVVPFSGVSEVCLPILGMRMVSERRKWISRYVDSSRMLSRMDRRMVRSTVSKALARSMPSKKRGTLALLQ